VVREPRVYRHRPWIVVGVLLQLLLLAPIAAAVSSAVVSPGIESGATALSLSGLLGLCGWLLVLSWRIRTVVDDEGVTQYWVTRSFRIRHSEITELEAEHVSSRWFLRAYCGERTFELIPCHTVIWSALSEALGPPRAMVAACRDIESCLAEVRKRELNSP
jgi:hypothetical protein